MERSEVLEHGAVQRMKQLKLYGMKAAYDEIVTTAIKREHEPQRVVGDLLAAEINEKKARSIKYQMTIAKMPLAKEIDEFAFEGTPLNETLIRDLAKGDFLQHQRNAVLIGGTGTGKTHLAVAIARACIRNGARGRFFNVVDLVNNRGAQRWTPRPVLTGRGGRQTCYAVSTSWSSTSWAICPSLRPAGSFCSISSGDPQGPSLRTHIRHRHNQPRLWRMAQRLQRCQNDHGAARPADASLRNPRNRQRELALQNTRLTPPSRKSHFGFGGLAASPSAPRQGPQNQRRKARSRGVIFARRLGVNVQRRLTLKALSARCAPNETPLISGMTPFMSWA